MSVEEEEALEKQINEIRDRIKRGETIAQQKNKERIQSRYGLGGSSSLLKPLELKMPL